MAVTIFVWNVDILRGNIGHASLYADTIKTYVSWWPHGSQTMTNDKKSEGTLPSMLLPLLINWMRKKSRINGMRSGTVEYISH